jgi:hypothetical protein
MQRRYDARTSTAVIIVKVFVALAPSFILQDLFESHRKLAYGVGLAIGTVAANYVPPRGNVQKLSILLCCAVILGIVRLILP